MTETKPPVDFAERATIRINVRQVRNVPIDEKIQHLYVIFRYDEKDLQYASSTILSHTWGATDPTTSKQGDKTHKYSWSENENHEIELAYDPFYLQQGGDTTLNLEVWKDEFPKIQGQTKDILVGSATYKLKDLSPAREATPSTISMPIQSPNNEQYQGEVDIEIHFGKPLRKAYLALSRLSVVFEMRDTIIRRICAMIFMVYSHTSCCVRAHPKLSLGAGIALLAVILGIVSISMFFIVPFLFITLLTFPLWIVPLSIGTFFTAPLWLPLLFIGVVCCMIFFTLLITLAFTSRKVRKNAYLYLSRFKKTPMGQHLFYE